MFLLILALITSIITLLYILLTRNTNYWKKRGVPHLPPSLMLGNYGDFILMRKNLGSTADQICKQFPDAPLVGAYYGTEPAVIVKDPELIKIVMTKDFYYFSCRELLDHKHRELINKSLFNESGNQWKVIRQNLTPLFSSAKMKNMFHLIKACTHTLDKMLFEEIKKNEMQDVRFLFGRFTMDCIGSCAFGLETKVMGENANDNAFKVIADKIFDTSTSQTAKTITRSMWPGIFYALRFSLFPKDVEEFFKNVLIKVFKERNYKPTERLDFVDLILSLKLNEYIIGDGLKKGGDTDKERIRLKVDEELLIAQCIVFFGAGFETSATTACYTLYELAKDRQAQDKVVAEVDEYLRRHEGSVDYDCLKELPYLEACIDEALRLYPVVGLITREIVEDYKLPSGLVLEKGLRVHIPVYHLQHHPEYFPEPEQFRPERFLGDEKQNIKPHTYMPFGEGPRICIGMRFAKMQMLAGLVTIFKRYRVALADDTPLFIEFEPKSVISHPKHKLNLKFVERTDI